LSALFYRDSFGGQLNFDEFELDARAYVPFVLHSVLALQFYGVAVAGQPPFHYLPQIGGQYLLRGLELGRYRDRVYTAVQAEWRVPLFWRIGAVAFVGIGNVYPGLAEVRLDDFKATGGLGLRVALKKKERVQFRFDVGFAENGPKFYLNLLEAF
jgi:outer membrane protein assembly factor BamA